ncbi:MAG: DUF5050 domain-containing protein [Oscillospiraceae bacterium]|nr:DUF5050 domain-containing protein [Oscillospiraceae bacterium]
MKRLAAFIAACVIALSTCAVGASAAEYGRDLRCGDFTAQGEYIYGINGNNEIYRVNIVSGKKEVICKAEGDVPPSSNICVEGNYLYYISEYEATDTIYPYEYDAVYKVDIGSGKQVKIFDGNGKSDDRNILGIITSGDRLYIQIYIFVHDEVPGIYNVNICDTNGECLKICGENGSVFIDASDCEACVTEEERKTVCAYAGYADVWRLEETVTYNIVKIKSDLSEEKITIPAKIIKNVKTFVYCGEKYVYYIDKDSRLCRYNTETEKYAVLADGDIAAAYYKDGAVYFLTNGGELKKYKKSKITVLDEKVSAAYFFNEYILYYGENASLENDIPKIISFKTAD